ncbi:MAG: hypothetical protein ABJB09_01515 [Verrucomicrobiota bacterium]
MKRTILILACAVIAPLAFAQTSTTTKTETTTTTTDGTVTTFTPGQSIVVKTTSIDPISYLLGKTVQYVNKAGKEIDAAMVKPGAKVHVIYDRDGDKMIVSRVVVDDD